MQKTIVSHYSPDMDGIPAIWLLRKYHPDFIDAKIAFVAAGDNTLNNEPVDSNPNVVHVDCGGGRFDHHKTNDFTCGAKLVWEWLIKEGYIKAEDKALERMIQVITELDHGWDNYRWPEPNSDRWQFSLHNILGGWKILYPKQDEKHIEWTLHALDAVYRLLELKVKAEKELDHGVQFKTRWGKGIGVFTANDGVIDAAIGAGYAVVLRKDPGKGYIRVTGSNSRKVDLTKAYDMLVAKDPKASWFLHASKVLLRNGSTRNPIMVPTKLELTEVIEILEKS